MFEALVHVQVNMPKCPFHNNHMDGAMNYTIRDEEVKLILLTLDDFCCFTFEIYRRSRVMRLPGGKNAILSVVGTFSGRLSKYCAIRYCAGHVSGELLAQQCGEEWGDTAAKIQEHILQL